MRLSGLAVIATVVVTAAQVPIVETRPAIQAPQPPRDAVQRAEPTGTARIRGRVVSADRGTPARRAMVMLTTVIPPPLMRGEAVDSGTGQRGAPVGRAGQPNGQMVPRRATTDVDGQFEFAGLPAGTYRISASPGQYSSQYVSMTFGATRP